MTTDFRYLARCGSLAALAAGLAAAPARASDTLEAEAAKPPTGMEEVVARGRGQTYEPEYFERFAPRNALDMVEQIPGFSISGGGGNDRGLGQADENVLINGERFSSKSDGVREQLQRIAASNVVRIEVVDGATLDVPGLTGQVANVVVVNTGASGQFDYRVGFKLADTADPALYGGEISLTGSTGALDFTVAVENRNSRFGAKGPILITNGFGDLVELQETASRGRFDNPVLSTSFSYDFGGETVANLNLRYGEDFFNEDDDELGIPVAGPLRTRVGGRGSVGPEYEIGGDIEFLLAGGRMKLIGLERFERDNDFSQIVDTFEDPLLNEGTRFEQVSESGERIGRFEYGWQMFSADWQLAGEAAFNRLDRVSRLFTLDDSGQFQRVAFPGATGNVKEDRYEAILSFSKQLTDNLALQATGGAEYSKIEQTGVAANSRSFQRPKGSVSLAWTPSNTLDASIEIRRDVGQLSFGDFLASVQLDEERENETNNQLVPSQTWEIQAEITKSLGDWGSTNLIFEQRWIEDLVDIIPLPGGGEARGNIDTARRTEIEWLTTLRFDPIGGRGMQLELRLEYEEGEVVDPVTGFLRDFSGGRQREVEIDYRHDIPGSAIAYGGAFSYNDFRRQFRIAEVSREFDGPVFVNVFVEHKDVMGLTVNARMENIFGGRDRFFRTVFDGPRNVSPILFVEDRDRKRGPTFTLSVSGNF